MTLHVRPAETRDADAIWSVISPIIAEGETLALPRDLGREAALEYWLAPAHTVFVAELEGAVAGTCYLRANQLGGGAHVANAGYATAEHARGRGIARRMALHSLAAARERGFRAMQFNLVVSTNTRAVALWQSLGFTIVGTLPEAFAHPRLGFVDAYVMSRPLSDATR